MRGPFALLGLVGRKALAGTEIILAFGVPKAHVERATLLHLSESLLLTAQSYDL